MGEQEFAFSGSTDFTATVAGSYWAVLYVGNDDWGESNGGEMQSNDVSFEEVQPTVTLSPEKIVTGAGTQSTLTASVSQAGNYSYAWSITAPNQGDNAGIVSLSNCAGQATCNFAAGFSGGKATVQVTVTDGYGNQVGSATARVIVVQIQSVTATVNASIGPAQTMSLANPLSLGNLTWPDPDPEADPTWKNFDHLTLVGGSVPKISLQVTSDPPATDTDVAGYIKFDPVVQRSPYDSVLTPLQYQGLVHSPSLTGSGQADVLIVSTTAGSFQILVFVDANSNGSRDTTETGIAVPLVVVSVEVAESGNASAVSAEAIKYQWNADTPPWSPTNPPGFAELTTGNFDITEPAENAVYLAADVVLVGGGPDGLLGLESVFGAWNQNVTGDASTSTYNTGHYITYFYVHNPDQANLTIGGIGYFLSGSTPDPYSLPLIDNGPTITPPGRGGNSSTISSRVTNAVALQLGRQERIEAVDSPGQPALGDHPGWPTGTVSLTQTTINLAFDCRLLFWASDGRNDGANGVWADRVYLAMLDQPWKLVVAYTVTPDGSGTPSQGSANAGPSKQSPSQVNVQLPVLAGPPVSEVIAANAQK
jgi:hypothetical protein